MKEKLIWGGNRWSVWISTRALGKHNHGKKGVLKKGGKIRRKEE